MRLRPALALAALVVALGAAPASAYWVAGGAGIGWASAYTLGPGAQPSGLGSVGSVTVTWSQTPFDLGVLGALGGGGYVVTRYPGGGGAAVTPNTSCGATISGARPALSCVELGVPPGFWRYAVMPILGSWTGAQSPRSSPIPVPPAAPVLGPADPRNPAAGQVVGDVHLTWSASSGATGYNVYRRAIGGLFDFSRPLNGALPLSATTWVDPGLGLSGAATYAYAVRAVTSTIESANSNERAATTYARPVAPYPVIAAPAPAAAIAVSWAAVAGATGYGVYRRTPPAASYGPPLNGATLVTSTTFSDATAVHATGYRFVVRAVAAGAGGVPIESFDSAETPLVTADGVAPAGVAMLDPGSPLRGTVTVAGGASDAGSGIAAVRFQHRLAGGATWTDGCVDAAAPYACALATATIADGLYDLRAHATDVAGNPTASAVVAIRRIDNTAPAVLVADPGAFVRATIALIATAVDLGSGLASFAVQIAPTGSASWTNVCTPPSSPASCPLNTATLADGGYDLRALASDVAGNAGTSATVVNRVVDNTRPSGTDVQATNKAGGTEAKPETGDLVTYTLSEPMLASSILAGWTGAATPVVVRFTEGNPDLLTVYNATNTVQLALGSVDIGKKYVDTTMLFSGSTMVLGRSTISITLGTPNGATVKATGTNQLRWTTSTAATDRAGNPLLPADVGETGTNDVDF